MGTQPKIIYNFDVLFEDFNKNIDIIIFSLENTLEKINGKCYLHIVIIEIIKINNQYLHNGFGSLHFIVKLRPYLKVIDLLIKNGANIHTFNKDGYTPLDLAIFANIKFIIDLLITKYEANINFQDLNNDTLLYKIINKRCNFPYDYYDGGYDFDLGEFYNFQHCKKLIKLKKKYDFDLDVCNRDGYTPLHIAILKDNEKIIKLLMDNGANINYVLEKEKEYNNFYIIDRIKKYMLNYENSI